MGQRAPRHRGPPHPNPTAVLGAKPLSSTTCMQSLEGPLRPRSCLIPTQPQQMGSPSCQGDRQKQSLAGVTVMGTVELPSHSACSPVAQWAGKGGAMSLPGRSTDQPVADFAGLPSLSVVPRRWSLCVEHWVSLWSGALSLAPTDLQQAAWARNRHCSCDISEAGAVRYSCKPSLA